MPTELDPAADPDAPSRAAEVLDRLVRDRQPTASRRRSGTPGLPSGLWPPAGRSGRWAAALALVAAVAILSALVLLRRPPPIEDRLPIAGAGSDTTGRTAVTSDRPGAADTTADEGASSAGSGPSTTAAEVVVHVAGAVAAPGVVRLSSGSRVVDAVTAAGGLRADADPDRVNLAAALTDGQRVVVPVLGQPVPPETDGGAAGAAGPGGAAGDGGVAAGSPAAPIDLNTATAEELDTLPGVGPSTAAAIIDHRESSGPFRSVDALLDVRGIGEAKLEALRDLVTAGGS